MIDLAEQIRQQVAGLSLSLVHLQCAEAKAFEMAGEYELARAALGKRWARVGEPPNLDGLSEAEAGAVLLRAGRLTGWLGSSKQLEGAQDESKRLLGQSLAIFERLGDDDSAADALNGIGLADWRLGDLDNARATYKCLQGRPGVCAEQRVLASLNLAIVEWDEGRFDDAVRIYRDVEPLARSVGDPLLLARLHHGYALARRGRGDNDRALEEYAATTYYLEQAGHTGLLAIVLNNHGFLCNTLGRHEEALALAGRAQVLYAGLKDRRGVAQTGETCAKILLEMERYEEAEMKAREAVTILRRGEEKKYLVETLVTHGVSLARLGRFGEALSKLTEAQDIARDLEGMGPGRATEIERTAIEEVHAPHCFRAGVTLGDAMHLFEKAMIKLGLRGADKDLLRASLRLGVKRDTLRKMINYRHPDLLDERTPVSTRRKSIVKVGKVKGPGVAKISDRRKG